MTPTLSVDLSPETALAGEALEITPTGSDEVERDGGVAELHGGCSLGSRRARRAQRSCGEGIREAGWRRATG
jgi:hypothetical protein